MGSFNIKCMATGQVIASKDRCRIAVVLQAASYAEATIQFDGAEHKRHAIRQHASKPSSMWAPMTAFLSGRYDDMATVKLDATEENRASLAVFFNELYRQAAVTLPGDNDNRGIAFDFQAAVAERAPKLHAALSAQKHFFQTLSTDELDMAEAMVLWDVVQKAVCENRVYYMGSSQVLRQVEMAVVHEASFRRLVAVAEGLRTRDGELIYAREVHFSTAFGELKAELEGVEDADKRFFKKDNFRNRLHFCMDSELTRPVHWPFRDDIEAGVNLVLDDGKPVSAFLERCGVVLDCLYAFKGLDVLNIQFTPITYMGQDDENFTGQRYADFVAGAAAEITAARKALREE
jgi:hypothetical protein